MQIFSSYAEVCDAVKSASPGVSIWCSSEFLRMQGYRYAQFRRPGEKIVFRAVPNKDNPPKLVSFNRLAICKREIPRPKLRLVN